jgi:hypothetical protein
LALLQRLAPEISTTRLQVDQADNTVNFASLSDTDLELLGTILTRSDPLNPPATAGLIEGHVLEDGKEP